MHTPIVCEKTSGLHHAEFVSVHPIKVDTVWKKRVDYHLRADKWAPHPHHRLASYRPAVSSGEASGSAATPTWPPPTACSRTVPVALVWQKTRSSSITRGRRGHKILRVLSAEATHQPPLIAHQRSTGVQCL